MSGSPVKVKDVEAEALFDFDAPIERRGTGSRKWGLYPADVLPLWVADMDFAAPPPVVEALRERLAHPVFGYGGPIEPLRAEVVAHVRARYGWAIEPAWVVVLPGVVPGFNMALKGLLAPGDAVVVQTPVYRPILAAPGHWGMRRLDVDMPQGRGAAIPDALAPALAEARAFILCNPHNPTGRMYRRDELEGVAALCERHDVLVVSDEIHCDLGFDGREHVPIASLSEAVARRSVTLMAASKTFNVAGLKSAFAIIPDPDLRTRFEAAGGGLVDSANVLGLEATLAALRHGEPWRRAALAYLQANRDALVALVAEHLPGARMAPPEGTFLAWIDCAAFGLADPQAFFLERARVGLNPGREFGEAFGSSVRLNFGCRRATMREAIERMGRALR